MDEPEYRQLADATLVRVARWVDQLGDEDVDCTAGDGIVTLEFPDGTRFVLNRQTAARQLWFAAGARAWHYGWDAGCARWTCDRDSHDLSDRLAAVVSEKLGRPVSVPGITT